MTDIPIVPNLSHLAATDPEFQKIIESFTFFEVPAGTSDLDKRRRYLSHLAVLMGSQAMDLFKLVLPAALENGISPREAKEVIYQATAYLGLGRVYPFLLASNSVFKSQGIDLPLEPAGEIELGSRLEKGEAAQVSIFGDHMKGFSETGDHFDAQMNQWLVANCFGDYYTRTGLSYATREVMTFCYLYAQGDCEPQLRGHIMANFRNGNDAKTLLLVVLANIPYIGYPRSLNALRVIKDLAEREDKKEEEPSK